MWILIYHMKDHVLAKSPFLPAQSSYLGFNNFLRIALYQEFVFSLQVSEYFSLFSSLQLIHGTLFKNQTEIKTVISNNFNFITSSSLVSHCKFFRYVILFLTYAEYDIKNMINSRAEN